MEHVRSIDDCLNRDIIASISYSPNSWETACFPHPRFRDDGTVLTPIDPEAFPDAGGLVAVISGGYDSEHLRSRFGKVVVMRLNMDSPDENPEYSTGKINRYRAYINPGMPAGRSDLEFKSLREHGLSKRLMQVVETSGLQSLGSAPIGPVSLDCQPDEVYTENVLVLAHGRNGDRLVGPMQAKAKATGVELSGAQEFDYRVYEFIGGSVGLVKEVLDRTGSVDMRFIETSAIQSAIAERSYIQIHDWIPRELLVGVLKRAIGLSEDMKDFGKNRMRRFRREIDAIVGEVDGVQMDKGRRQKVLDLASDIEYFSTLPDEIQDAVFERMDNEKLADIVCAPQNMPRFKSQLLDIPELREELDQERVRLTASLDTLRESEREARANLDSTNRELEEARKSLAERLNRAEAAESEELERLKLAVEEQASVRDALKGEIAELERSRDDISSQVDALLGLLDDRLELSAEVLKSEVVQRVVSFANGSPKRDARHAAASSFNILPSPDSSAELIDRLCGIVADQSGRSYQRNDVINFYTCLTQGYVTTFAGLPGTGKTSLCRLLAKGLGIDGEDDGRFVEVSVERGWASYRDYIGYYNPLTRTEERSNIELFSALEQLTGEAGADPGSVPPCIVLLDEANLSPIEHYWAPFLKACDSFAEKTMRLPIGGDRSLLVPRNARFLATVNYDHTTEELSARFLDRTWVIMLMPESIIEVEDEAADTAEHPDGMVSYADLVSTFGWRRQASMDSASEEILTKTLQACAACGHPVSPRSQNMMRSYMATAHSLMDTTAVSTRFAPLDFAVAQKVLPCISGPRESYSELVDALQDICSSLPVTSRLITNIQKAGEDGYYSFFA